MKWKYIYRCNMYVTLLLPTCFVLIMPHPVVYEVEQSYPAGSGTVVASSRFSLDTPRSYADRHPLQRQFLNLNNNTSSEAYIHGPSEHFWLLMYLVVLMLHRDNPGWLTFVSWSSPSHTTVVPGKYLILSSLTLRV
jgi:hypothetical protein